MNLEQIRSFCAVVEHGSHTRAARRLHLTQPAVSEHVRSLQRFMGIPLLERIDGRMRPTQAGEAVYHHGLEIIAQVDAMQSAVNALKGLHGAHVVFGAGITAGRYVLSQCVANFRHRYPEVRVEMRVDNASVIFEHVLQGAIEFGIALDYDLPQSLASVPLYREPLVFVVAPQHPLAQSRPGPIPRGVLAAARFIAFSEHVTATRRMCDKWLRDAGMELHIDLEFDTSDSIKRVVAAGHGAAILHKNSVAVEIAAGLLKVLEVDLPPMFVQVALTGRPRQRFSPAARVFLQELVAGLQEEGLVEVIDVDAINRFIGGNSSKIGIPRG